MNKTQEPYEKYPKVWKTKAAFFTYIRGHLRQIWARYPPKLEWKKAQSFKPDENYTGRAKTLCTCYYCGNDYPASQVEVDHAEMAGECNSWETAATFLSKLLDVNAEWRIACRPCHKIKSYAERMDITFEEAAAIKRAIDFTKQDSKLVIAYLQGKGYNGEAVSSAQKRRALVEKLFKEEACKKK